MANMAFYHTISLLYLSVALSAVAESATPTTLEPVFTYPFDGTSTIYQSTATETSFVDCMGSVLVITTYPVSDVGGDLTTNTATVTSPKTTSSEFTCLPSTSRPSNLSTTSVTLPNLPTSLPLPPINQTAQTLIDELRTAILYVSLLGNGGPQAKLCSSLNPAALSNGTGYNGTAVQNEVCASAAIQKYLPAFSEILVLENQNALQFLTVALFAVQVVSGFAGGNDRAKLCSEVREDILDPIFVGFDEGTGTEVKRYVCGT